MQSVTELVSGIKLSVPVKRGSVLTQTWTGHADAVTEGVEYSGKEKEREG